MMEDSLDTLQIGNLVWSDVVHFVLGDDTKVNIAARAKVIEDTSGNGISNQLHCVLPL